MSAQHTFDPCALRIGPHAEPLPGFLRRAADELEGHGTHDPLLVEAIEALLAGGLDAVHERPGRPQWAEYRLRLPAATGEPDLYAALGDLARQLLSTEHAEDFFFMHKEPGMRVRFRLPASGGKPEETVGVLDAAMAEWQHRGLTEAWSRAVYEPEQHLFGGPVSMASVHRLFTADSLAWAEHWAHRPEDRRPAWAISLVMIEALLDGLRIVGWEDRDVWDRLRRQAGRSLAGDEPEGWGETIAKIHRVWSEPGRLASTTRPWNLPYPEAFARAARTECPRWLAEYFASPEAYVGPREAAAFFIVYHWNRAALPFSWQCAIVEALLR
ncbi:thiopeptide-type bacteriocin biosynthesis protein [Streptomyces sp. NBC_00158]|uniref:thiopeptide-type bacteriocin biosynthesis protein n=1 Tax=Streptomyces sp. NBC_00158 TaxID=2903627 RepID=UPI002F90ED42